MKHSQILIIDDEDLFREDLAVMLRREGYRCHTAENAERGIKTATEIHPDIILSDIAMPDRLGTEIIGDLQAVSPMAAIIMITAFGNLESAIDAFRLGATDYLLKPLSKDELLNKISRLEEHLQLRDEVFRLRAIVRDRQKSDSLFWKSPPMLTVKDYVTRVAEVDSTVLITGESGSGKEVVAREIHRLSSRSKAPFLAINCSAIPDQLLESELFGHKKGAFTGAIESRIGFFEMAKDGTLLLDEIGEMPLNLQTKLLRTLEQKEFYQVGSTQPTTLKARIISSTNRDLSKLVADKIFREDLFYRLNIVEIHVPPLRDRREDIPFLVDFFLHQLCREFGREKTKLSPSALESFTRYDWPGNVRQLRNVLERTLILSPNEELQISDFPKEISGNIGSSADLDSNQFDNLREATLNFEKKFIKNMIQKCGGNREKAAKKMGINPSTLYRKLSEHQQTGQQK